MKRITPLLFVAFLTFLFESCKKENQSTAFNYEKAAGIWVPYEMISAGMVSSGSFTANSFFGAYAESVKLNTDRTFIPVMWISNTNHLLKTNEQGTYTYITGDQRIMFESTITHMDCMIVKFQDNELWLDVFGILYKLRKQL